MGGVIIVILTEYLVNFRTGLSDKYRQKIDCEKIMSTCHDENREDHQIIFKRIEKEHVEILRKLDDITRQIFDIVKGINKLNGN